MSDIRPKGPGVWLEWHCAECPEKAGGVTDATPAAGQAHADKTGHAVPFTEMSTRVLTRARREPMAASAGNAADLELL